MAIVHNAFPAAAMPGRQEQQRATLAGLRSLLAEKYPQAPQHQTGQYRLPLATEAIELPLGGVIEVTGSLASGGLFLEAVVQATYERRGMMALVDAEGSFDPAALLETRQTGRADEAGQRQLERLLWINCGRPERRGEGIKGALKATDLLLRDGNLSTIVLDLQMAPLAALRGIPANTWYRFQRIVEPTNMLFIVLTPVPFVSSAVERFELRGGWSLQALCETRASLSVPIRRAGRCSEYGRQIA